MKFIIALILSFSFTSAFAGGQTGSGMNGCWVRNFYGVREWRSIEEIMYPEIILRRPSRSIRSYDINPQWNYVPNTQYANLTGKYYVKRALKRISQISTTHPKTHLIFNELFKLFRRVQVSTFKLDGIFKGELTTHHSICKDFSPAMMTFRNGSIVVFKPVFEQLDGLSSEILYVHETIRFAQTFHPVFHDMTDSELQHLSSLFFLNRPDYMKFNEILKKYEERLVQAEYKIGSPKPYIPSGESYDTERMFRSKFQEAVFYYEENLGDELNKFRATDVEFMTSSYEEISRVLNSAKSTKIIGP
ncbi:hypothetical protein [Peredibacter starrii]|uniref:Uncharacterized protein n=1 Tax=Peredibacter starrii TaxID=28202 RepID=A0AAX4HUV9_9BACT|nr:hypothetical protein [Peredibacter starrii]WPU67082.1 hypothetical protein SOO65_09985 [Peredibacter starrii]